MYCFQSTIVALIASAVLLENVQCGVILDRVKDDVRKAEKNINCAFKNIESFLGFGNKCEPNTNLNPEISNNMAQGGYDAGNNLQQPNYGQNYGRPGFGSNQDNLGVNGFGQNSFTQQSHGTNNLFQGAPGQGGYDSVNAGNYGQNFGLNEGGYGGSHNVPTEEKFRPGDENISNVTSGPKGVNTEGLDMRFQTGSESTTAASGSTTKKFQMDGRRIISAHSNCGPGFVADSRGRCRETF